MELSPFLNSTDSLAEQQNFTNSFGFEGDFDRDIITTSKILNGAIKTVNIADAAITNAKLGTAVIGTAQIGTLSFNQISGGTANLGGTTNGNGLLSLKNAAGSEIVKLDNTGMTVTNGSITINNSSGSAIIDSSGVNSVNNFSFGTLRYDASQNVSGNGTAWNDIPNTSQNIVLARQASVLVMSTGQFNSNNTNDLAQVRINVGGNVDARFLNIRNTALPITLTNIVSLSAGTHVFKLQCVSGPTDELVSQTIITSYVVLGK